MRRLRRDRAIDAVQDLALRLCVGGGFVLGLLAGLQGHPPTASCEREPCVGEQLAGTLWSVFGPAAAGAAAGLALGLIVVLSLKRLRPRGTERERSMRWITARSADRCRRCAGSTAAGERILWDASAGAVTCQSCAT